MGGWRPGGPKSDGRYAVPKNLIAKIAKKSREDRKEKTSRWVVFPFSAVSAATLPAFAFKGFFSGKLFRSRFTNKTLGADKLKDFNRKDR
jgi:hypothetical protein